MGAVVTEQGTFDTLEDKYTQAEGIWRMYKYMHALGEYIEPLPKKGNGLRCYCSLVQKSEHNKYTIHLSEESQLSTSRQTR